MQDIKLRFWDEKKNKMIYGPTDDNDSPLWVMQVGAFYDIDLDINTGIKDKKGIEVFENDEVKFIATIPGEEDFQGTVKQIEGCWVIDNGKTAIMLWQECSPIEVIGNIHTKPKIEVNANRYYDNGMCTLTDTEQRCMYKEGRQFCDDCTRANLVYMQETHIENNEV